MWASTDEGFNSSARFARVTACGGLSSDSARAEPTSAGTSSAASACSAIWYERSASARSYFSRNRSPHAVWIAASPGASPAASRYAALASLKRPSARSARPARATSCASRLVFALLADRLEDRRRVVLAEHLLQQAEFERRFARRRARRDRPQQRFGVGVAAARDQRSRLDRRDRRVADIKLLRQRVGFVEAALDEGARRGLQG